MSQAIFNEIDPELVGGIVLADMLNGLKEAIVSGMSGTSRPTELDAGGNWIDTTDIGTGILRFKIYTGTTDITVFTINLTTSKVSIEGSEEYFEISKVSADTVGPYVSFMKKRPSEQVKSGDIVGEIRYQATDELAASHVVGRIRYIATADVTSTNNGGGYLSIEGSLTGATIATEFARFVNGRLAIGLQNPTHTIHTRGVGAKHERVAEDATGVKVTRKKARTINNGQNVSGDEISSDETTSVDNAGTEFTAVQIKVSADENHTASARGSVVELKTIAKGETSLDTRVKFYEKIAEFNGRLSIDAMERRTQTFASVSEVLALNAEKSFIEVTGTTAMTIKGILSTSASQSFFLYNASTQNITIENQAVDAVEANRIAVNGETSFTIQPGKGAEFVRRSSVNRWSPLIESVTGITYNDAVDLVAKQAAASLSPVALRNANTGAAVVSLISNTIREQGIADLFMLGYTSTGKTVIAIGPQHGIAMGNILTTEISDANYDVSVGQWTGVAATIHTEGANIAVGVRALGSIRSVFFTLGTFGGASAAQATLTNIDNASAWAAIAGNPSTGRVIAVAQSGTYRIGRMTLNTTLPVAATWDYKASTTFDVPLRSIAYGNGIWVAVGGVVPGGSSNHAAWVSTDDGATWASYALPNEATYVYHTVRYCNSQFIALGYSGSTEVLYTSPDGITWTLRSTANDGTQFIDVAYGRGLYMVSLLGNPSYEVLYSTSATTWVYGRGCQFIGKLAFHNRTFWGVQDQTGYLTKSVPPNIG